MCSRQEAWSLGACICLPICLSSSEMWRGLRRATLKRAWPCLAALGQKRVHSAEGEKLCLQGQSQTCRATVPGCWALRPTYES